MECQGIRRSRVEQDATLRLTSASLPVSISYLEITLSVIIAGRHMVPGSVLSILIACSQLASQSVL